MAGSEEWDWRFSDRSEREFENLQQHEKERIVTKLDEIVTDQWRDPADYVEPLTGQPHSKLRVGAFRLGCDVDQAIGSCGCTRSRSGQERTNPGTTNLRLQVVLVRQRRGAVSWCHSLHRPPDNAEPLHL
jgi:mRNA interferase RelE/StbE